ncbi:ABC transporter permease [Nocardioides bizhenqiangii]|uniref:ABC transporter permease n=1 Tax=Nocardioides bizhenqiangii TaxID=3095076 RepID=A0ABZ0ZTU6_9ACTN|nr:MULTISPECIES: ABC transporter permease [unclassified Nocardioides]MDZ5623403.1 ABC transporter permease [Nocardioides sp. HM23]WQQ27727.1 ABC transporter permease [Nocardioides sp. HM61]
MTSATAAPTLDISGTRPIPFWRLVVVELRKSYDTRAGFWLLATIAILVALVEGIIMITALVNDGLIYFEDFAATAGGITSLLLPVLGIVLVTSEWGQRTGMVTFAIEPRRMRVVMAKLVVGVVASVATVAVMLVIGTLCTLVCELVQPELTIWNMEWWLPLAFIVTMTLTMTVGFSMAALLLNTPAAIVVFFMYWYGLAIVLFVIADLISGFSDIAPWINFQAALDPVWSWSLDSAEEVGQLVVSALLWIVAPLGFGLWRILSAEVK